MICFCFCFLLVVPGVIPRMQGEISKMACMVSKTINITANLLVEISQEMGELRTTVLQTRANTI